ncbi:molybdopterin converting factor subunit 1 [Prosthecomicrobium sp. N25]|uniref:molybdopterin converting factor subunit 1 n=1 Tax=Prosthecomicrobium sp. N25 TaxID=3129254 RepID=UPI003077C4AC
MRILYFAWVRERIGKAEETLEPPADVKTAGDLLRWLKGLGEEYDHALERPEVIRVAVDQRHVRAEAPIAGAREVALFPPMTGG